MVLVTGRAEAAAWVPDPGHFYLELRGLYVTTDQSFDPHGQRRALRAPDATPRRLSDGQMALYGEVGLATRLAVVADMTLLRALALDGNSGLSAIGVGDLHAGLRLSLLDEDVSVAVEARLGIPTGRSDAALPLGTGDLRGELTLSVGRVWERVPFFVQLALGGALRGSGSQRVGQNSLVAGSGTVTVDYASELTYGLELGYLASLSARGRHVRVSPVVRVDGRYGSRAPTTASPAGPLVDPVAPASMRDVRVTAQLSAEIPVAAPPHHPAAVIVAVGGGVFVWGQGLPAANEVSISIGWKR